MNSPEFTPLLRPVTIQDLDELLDLTKQTSFGLTTLPQNREYLHKKILKSIDSFSALSTDFSGRQYLFVLVNHKTGRIAGVSGVLQKVGGFDPFYAYKVKKNLFESKSLKVRKFISSLHLVKEHNGPSEIGSLFLSPEFRIKGLGKFLSLSRFLFIAGNLPLFDTWFMAEMRGVISDDGKSDFWESIGKHFFNVEFPKADVLSVLNKTFIAELMPQNPIYIPLLPVNAQEVIGKVHPQTEAALHILKQQGFKWNGLVDIFEAGPVVVCKTRNIKTVKHSRVKIIKEILSVNNPSHSKNYMISTENGTFQATMDWVKVLKNNEIAITRTTQKILKLKAGDHVRIALMP